MAYMAIYDLVSIGSGNDGLRPVQFQAITSSNIDLFLLDNKKQPSVKSESTYNSIHTGKCI